jgi:Protein of unknown function (DUF2934)
VSASAAAPARRKTKTTMRTRKNLPVSQAEPPSDSAIAPLPVVQAVVQADELAAFYQLAHEEVAALAYTYWAGRGRQGGSPEEDWLRAEQELRARSLATP